METKIKQKECVRSGENAETFEEGRHEKKI